MMELSFIEVLKDLCFRVAILRVLEEADIVYGVRSLWMKLRVIFIDMMNVVC